MCTFQQVVKIMLQIRVCFFVVVVVFVSIMIFTATGTQKNSAQLIIASTFSASRNFKLFMIRAFNLRKQLARLDDAKDLQSLLFEILVPQ